MLEEGLVDLDDVPRVARFEAAHPGIGPSNYPDAFRGADGRLTESTDFTAVDRFYGMAETGSVRLRDERVQLLAVGAPVVQRGIKRLPAMLLEASGWVGRPPTTCSTPSRHRPAPDRLFYRVRRSPAGKSWEGARHRPSGASRRGTGLRGGTTGSSPREVGRVGVHPRRSPPARRHATPEPRAAPTVAGRNLPLAPAPAWDPGLAAFPLEDVVFGPGRSVPKFRALEILNRVAYQAWEQAAYYLAGKLRERSARARQLHDTVEEDRTEQDNEKWHNCGCRADAPDRAAAACGVVAGHQPLRGVARPQSAVAGAVAQEGCTSPV